VRVNHEAIAIDQFGGDPELAVRLFDINVMENLSFDAQPAKDRTRFILQAGNGKLSAALQDSFDYLVMVRKIEFWGYPLGEIRGLVASKPTIENEADIVFFGWPKCD